MTNKQLKKLSRAELLEMLIGQMKENEQLRTQLDAARQQALHRQILIANAGSIAEASMQLSGIFSTAQAAADEYLENVYKIDRDQAQRLAKMEEESLRRVEENKRRADAIMAQVEEKCARREKEAEDYLRDISARLQRFYDERPGLRQMVQDSVRETADENEEQTAG